MADGEDERIVNTRDGMERIPRKEGVPFKDYFRNAEWPRDPSRAVVHATPSGPVLAKPDPVPWNAAHDEAAQDYAKRLKWVIDKRGYYGKTLQRYTSELRDMTTEAEDQVRTRIVAAFVDIAGMEPKAYREQRDAERGRMRGAEQGRGPDFGPEM